MSRPSVTPRQLEQLFQNLEDCQITGAEHAQLMELLRSDAEVRSAYIDHMEFAGLLHAKAEADAELDGAGGLGEEGRPARQFARSLVAAAAILILAGIAASLFYLPATQPASIVAGPNASWSFTSGGLDESNNFLPGSTVALEVGTLDIRLGTGTELILEGPAELGLIDSESVSLPDGRLWARAASEQFTVHTGRLKIVDLGTEFGVLASDRLDEEVHVKRGRVRVESKDPSLDPVTLEAGEAVRTDGSGKLRRVPFSKVGFLQELPSVVPYLHWSFDDSPDEQFPSDGQGISGASIGVYSLHEDEDPSIKRVEGRFGDALRLGGKGEFARSGFEGIEGDVARSVALWFRAGSQSMDPDLNPTLVAWGLPTEFGTKWRLTLDQSGTGFGTVWGGSWASSKVPREESILDGQWHHLVYVYTGRNDEEGHPEIAHYLDGEPLEVRSAVEAVPVNTECSAKHSRPVTLGCHTFSNPSRSTFTGEIDELYVFRGVLGTQQVRSLYYFNRLDDRGAAESGAMTNPSK